MSTKLMTFVQCYDIIDGNKSQILDQNIKLDDNNNTKSSIIENIAIAKSKYMTGNDNNYNRSSNDNSNYDVDDEFEFLEQIQIIKRNRISKENEINRKFIQKQQQQQQQRLNETDVNLNISTLVTTLIMLKLFWLFSHSKCKNNFHVHYYHYHHSIVIYISLIMISIMKMVLVFADDSSTYTNNIVDDNNNNNENNASLVLTMMITSPLPFFVTSVRTNVDDSNKSDVLLIKSNISSSALTTSLSIAEFNDTNFKFHNDNTTDIMRNETTTKMPLKDRKFDQTTRLKRGNNMIDTNVTAAKSSILLKNFNESINEYANHNIDTFESIKNSSSNFYHSDRYIYDNNNNNTLKLNNNISDIIISDKIKKPLKKHEYNDLLISESFAANETTSNKSMLMIMLSDQAHYNNDNTTSNNNITAIQQKNLYRYYSQRQENDLKSLLSRYPSLRLPSPPPEYADEFDEGITEISTVSGTSVDIPCNTTWIEDEVSLVLWFRGDTGVPIYRVDARSVPLSKAIHTVSNESRKRLFFDMKQQPPVLRINPVIEADAAEYRCRVDFRQSRTQNVIIKLNVTVPPKELLIMDVEGQRLEGVIGPYDEGSNVILICEAEGGKPSPSVNWYQANRLIDSSYTIGPHGLVRNELNILNLNRSNFMSILICRASNNNVTEPISATVILDMNLRPLDVKIMPKSYLKSKSSSSSTSHHSSSSSSSSLSTNSMTIDPRLSFILSAGSKAEFQCQSTGSRPAAQISWWLGNERLSSNVRDSVSEDGNATISTIVFVPNVDDNKKLLTCRADNLPMPHTALKDERLLNVQFAPQLRISFGTNIQTDSIREGSDVYMECRVKANPPVKEVVWLHEDRPIHSLMSSDPNLISNDSPLSSSSSTVIMTNQSLVIQKVHRSHRGRYQCIAFNEQGETVSDPLYLKVNFAPSCKPGQKLQYGVSRNEQIRIRCEVEAEPSTDLTFRWTLNTSGNGDASIEWASFTVNATTSIATFRPESSSDYGTLSCLAQNSIGIQNKPCVYSVVPAGRPDPVRGCAITNHSMNTLLVECVPGDDGGLRQHFNLEVYVGMPNNLDQKLSAQSSASISSPSMVTTTGTSSSSSKNSHSLSLQHPQRLHSNHSSSQPNFIVSSLTPGTPYTLVLYATNSKGRSHSVSLSAVTLSAPEKHTARVSFEQIVVHPILGILIGIVTTIVITVIILILLIRSRIGNDSNTNNFRNSGDNNSSSNNNNNNGNRKRRNKQPKQKNSPLQSAKTTTTASDKTELACTRRSLNGTPSSTTMMMINNNDNYDVNDVNESIELTSNDALLAIGSKSSSPIITSNGDIKLKKINESSKNILLFTKKKSPLKKFKNNDNKKQISNSNNITNISNENDSIIIENDIILMSDNNNDDNIDHCDNDINDSNDIDDNNDNDNHIEQEKVCLVENGIVIDATASNNNSNNQGQIPLHYSINCANVELLSSSSSTITTTTTTTAASISPTNNELMTTMVASNIISPHHQQQQQQHKNSLLTTEYHLLQQQQQQQQQSLNHNNAIHSYNHNCNISHLQQLQQQQQSSIVSIDNNPNHHQLSPQKRIGGSMAPNNSLRTTYGPYNHRSSIITSTGPYIHHNQHSHLINNTQLLDLSSTASSTGLSSSSTSSSPNPTMSTSTKQTIPLSCMGILGQSTSSQSNQQPPPLPPLSHHQIFHYTHSSPSSSGSPNHHHHQQQQQLQNHLNNPYDIDGSAAVSAIQYSQYHPYMNTGQYISPNHQPNYVDTNKISCLYATTSPSSSSLTHNNQIYDDGQNNINNEQTLFINNYDTSSSSSSANQFITDFTNNNHQQQQQQHSILYYNPNDEITLNESIINNNHYGNNNNNNDTNNKRIGSKRCNVTLLQSSTSTIATTPVTTSNISTMTTTVAAINDSKSNDYCSNANVNNSSTNISQQQSSLASSSSSSSTHEKICMINKHNGTAV